MDMEMKGRSENCVFDRVGVHGQENVLAGLLGEILGLWNGGKEHRTSEKMATERLLNKQWYTVVVTPSIFLHALVFPIP